MTTPVRLPWCDRCNTGHRDVSHPLSHLEHSFICLSSTLDNPAYVKPQFPLKASEMLCCFLRTVQKMSVAC